MADAVDVGEGQAGVLQCLEDHGHFELASGAVELTGGGDVVGDPHDGGRAAQRPILAAHSKCPRSRPDPMRVLTRSWATARTASPGRCWVPWGGRARVHR